MIYRCEIGAGECIEFENSGSQTRLTIASSRFGQQQQASNSFNTGAWTAPPQVLQTSEGLVIKLATEQGERLIQVHQITQSSTLVGHLSMGDAQLLQLQKIDEFAGAEPIEPMEPMKRMKPLEPMRLGDMEMSLETMTMRMGDRVMQMGNAGVDTSTVQLFCTQCGTRLSSGERFCAHCGQAIDRSGI
jgi:hypothetical protein